MSAPAFTPPPWEAADVGDYSDYGGNSRVILGDDIRVAVVLRGGNDEAKAEGDANARLIAAAPDHALICWAMCVQDGRWDEWLPFDGRGEFCFAGLKYATRVDEFGCPVMTPALREAISKSQTVAA